MRIPLPRTVVCCHGLAGVCCLADWVNHQMLRSNCHRLCDRHEAHITAEFIIEKYWLAH